MVTASKVAMSSEISQSPKARFKITDAEKAHFSSVFNKTEVILNEADAAIRNQWCIQGNT